MNDESSSPESRRRHERVTLAGMAVLSELDDGGSPMAFWPVRVVDISRSGLGVHSSRVIDVGRRVVIEMLDKADDRVRVLFAQARQCRGLDGVFMVGLEFERFGVAPSLAQYLEQWRERVAGTPAAS